MRNEVSSGAQAQQGGLRALAPWWMLAVLLIFYILSILDRLIMVMLVEPIKHDMGFTDFQMSLLLGPAFGLFYAVFGLPLAWAADRFPRRSVIAVGAAFWCLATMMCGLAGSFWRLFLSRMAVGVGEASLSPAAYTLVADKFPQHRLTTALAIYALGPRLGSAAAYSIGPLAIAFAWSVGIVSLPFIGEIKPWQLVFLMVGLPGLLITGLVFTFSEPARGTFASTALREAKNSDGGLLKFVMANKALVGLMMLGFGAVSISTGAEDWIPSYVTRRFGLTPSEYGPALSIISLVTAVSVLVKGGIVDLLFARGMKDAHLRFYTWLLMISTSGAAVAFLLTSPLPFLIVVGIVNTVTTGFTIYMAAIVQLITPTHLRAQMGALFLFFCTIGASIGPMAVGSITDFILKDSQQIGIALGIVMTVGPAIAFMALRAALRLLRPFLDRQQETHALQASAAAQPQPAAD